MDLQEFFKSQTRGAKADFARSLGITKTWMSLILSGRKLPSPALCILIEKKTNGIVKKEHLRPDIFE